MHFKLCRHAGLGMTLYVHALLEIVSRHSLSSQQRLDSQKDENHFVESNCVLGWFLCKHHHFPGVRHAFRICSKTCVLDSIHDGSHSSGGMRGKILSSALETARHSDLNVFHFIGLFAGLLREALDDICSKYVNLFLEKV